MGLSCWYIGNIQIEGYRGIAFRSMKIYDNYQIVNYYFGQLQKWKTNLDVYK